MMPVLTGLAVELADEWLVEVAAGLFGAGMVEVAGDGAVGGEFKALWILLIADGSLVVVLSPLTVVAGVFDYLDS